MGTKKMEKDIHEHYVFLKNTLLAISGGSWIGWEWLRSASEFCSLVLPITGVVSFMLYLIINHKNIVKGLKEIVSGTKNQDPGQEEK